jgi:hypothetical protein
MTTAHTIDFATFVLSLTGSAMVHLGAVPDPNGEKHAPNLELARQTVDILNMLRQKTQGNLDGRESELLDRVLHDIRVAYVEASHRAGS